MAILSPLEIQEKKIEESKFRLAHIVSQRAKMLMRGSKPLVEAPYCKAITLALQEVAEGKVSYYNQAEAQKILEGMEQRAREQEEMELKAMQEKQKATAAAKEKKEAEKAEKAE